MSDATAAMMGAMVGGLSVIVGSLVGCLIYAKWPEVINAFFDPWLGRFLDWLADR